MILSLRAHCDLIFASQWLFAKLAKIKHTQKFIYGTFPRKKKKIGLLASKESAKLALYNDAILALVAASVFSP